ncbi:uncharacterized protein VNE69_09176 [Vairimorpha necatrix]|uniref:CTCHY-type domain-containing protein n=1 Tax=Vairimorpha necatrix TaxID=6039 RepID=A0AAX4JF26_9MICR
MCSALSRPIFIVDSYDMEICTLEINFYTSREFLGCYECRNKIDIKRFICEKCDKTRDGSKYCRGCGRQEKYYKCTRIT